jgi:heme A synthase
MTRRDAIDVVSSLLGSILVAVALALIIVARVEYGGSSVYVSELGATGVPTAKIFEAALLLIVAGGTSVAYAGRDIRSRLRLLAIWTPSISLWISCGFFLVASQVTCRYECPLPTLTPFDAQDFTHITCAVIAFAAACWGILQCSSARHHIVLRRFSLGIAIAVGMISGLGGILSLLQFDTQIGANAELTATVLAIAWVVVYGIVIAASRIRGQRPDLPDPEPLAEVDGDIRSSNRLASPTST